MNFEFNTTRFWANLAGAFALWVGVFVLSSPGFASGPGTSGMSFVNLTGSIRGASLSNATTALNSIDSMLTNPAGLANQRAPALRLQLLNYVDSGRFYHIAGAIPFGYGVVGGDLGVLDYGQQLRTTFADRTGASGDSFGARSQKLGLSYAMAIDSFTVGTSVSLLSEVLDSQTLTAWGADVGGVYAVSPTLRIGAAMTQLTFKGQSANGGVVPLPSAGRVGICWENPSWNWPTLILADLVIPSSEPIYGQGGVETSLNEALVFRLGYTSRAVFSQFSTGIGITIGDVNVDFSYHPSATLGDYYRAGVGIKW